MSGSKKRLNARNIDSNEFFYGHKACGGCGESLALRHALKVLGEDAYLSLPAGCMAAVSFIYPNMAFKNNAIITPFASTAAVTTGIAAGLEAIGKENPLAFGIAGDGGTADIGIQALSGAIDRGDRFIYMCTDNEAYMNTGIQKKVVLLHLERQQQQRHMVKQYMGILQPKRTCLRLLQHMVLNMPRRQV